jgi:hypothetical protein
MGKDIEYITAPDWDPAFDLLDVQKDIKRIAGDHNKPVNWGWFQEGYDHESTDPANGPATFATYIAHHNGPQYFAYEASNPLETGARLKGLGDFFAAIKTNALPADAAVFYVRGGYGNLDGLLPRSPRAAVKAALQGNYERIAFKSMAQNFEILPDVIAKDPLAPAYRLDDPQWAAAIVNWTVEALIQAEQRGVTQGNLAEMKKSDDLAIRRLFGLQRGYGQYLGLDDAWAARIIEAVGNYGEMFERDLGAGSPMKLARGPNNLWTQGGLMCALPIR